jgi:hypothetical protein
MRWLLLEPHNLPYQSRLVVCCCRCPSWDQFGPFPPLVDAARGALAPESRRAHSRTRRFWSRCGGRATGLGRTRVWVLEHRAAPGSAWCRTTASGRLTGMGATVPSPVTWSVSDGHVSKGVRPSITVRQRARPCPRSHWASPPVSAL